MSNIIAMSSQVDHELSLLLVRLLGANARVAHAMFDALRSEHLKKQVLVAAAEVELATDPNRLKVLQAVLRSADVAQADRNKIAHWVCGECPELPNDLLLANPSFVRSQSIAQARIFEQPADSTLSAFLLRGDVIKYRYVFLDRRRRKQAFKIELKVAYRILTRVFSILQGWFDWVRMMSSFEAPRRFKWVA